MMMKFEILFTCQGHAFRLQKSEHVTGDDDTPMAAALTVASSSVHIHQYASIDHHQVDWLMHP